MSELFTYICTAQTADPYVPQLAASDVRFQRNVADGFAALVGGYRTVGKLAFFPVQRAVPFHLLCNGAEVAKASFPELYEYLGDTQGTPADADNFVLPNFIGGALTPAATATTETIESGTVTSETSTPGDGDSGGSIKPAVDSGGRVRTGGVALS